MAWFANASVRSSDGSWVVEFPDRSWNDSAPKQAIVRSGGNGLIAGELDAQIPDSDLYGQMTGAFCGTPNRFIAASENAVAAYEIPSGALLTSFSTQAWQDPGQRDARPAVACSSSGAVAILAGSRLTLYNLK